MNEHDVTGHGFANEEQRAPIAQEEASEDGKNPSVRQIAFYRSKLAFLLLVVPIIAALIFPFLPFVHIFDEPGSGTALGIIIGYYVMFAGPAWFLGTIVALVYDFRVWRRQRRAGAFLSGQASKRHHAFNAVFWLVFLPVVGFVSWFILAGFFR